MTAATFVKNIFIFNSASQADVQKILGAREASTDLMKAAKPTVIIARLIMGNGLA